MESMCNYIFLISSRTSRNVTAFTDKSPKASFLPLTLVRILIINFYESPFKESSVDTSVQTQRQSRRNS